MSSRRRRPCCIASALRDRDLVRLYWPVALRPAYDALFGIDDALGDIVANSTQPALGAIRLAWWRDALERLDTSSPPPEPRLRAVAAELLPRGVSGADVAQLEGGWAALFEEQIDLDRVSQRGTTLFAIGARLLGASDPRLDTAGRLFACADAIRRGLSPIAPASDPALAGHRFARPLRPLTALSQASTGG